MTEPPTCPWQLPTAMLLNTIGKISLGFPQTVGSHIFNSCSKAVGKETQWKWQILFNDSIALELINFTKFSPCLHGILKKELDFKWIRHHNVLGFFCLPKDSIFKCLPSCLMLFMKIYEMDPQLNELGLNLNLIPFLMLPVAPHCGTSPQSFLSVEQQRAAST